MNKMITQEFIDNHIALAESIVKSNENAEKSDFSERMGGILKNPDSKHFLIKMMDVAFRSKNYSKISDYVIALFRTDDSASSLFSFFEKILVFLYKKIGFLFPSISIPAMLTQIKSVTAPILFFVGDSKFKSHSKKRKSEGVVLNVNLIGEALLGEEEAAQRISNYKALLNQEEVDYISIKLSTIFSQISSLAHEYTIDRCVEKLSMIYDEVIAVENRTGVTKFVNLDMEEYRDLSITIDTFKKTLSLPRFKNLRMGIVLQAYLPDSYNALKDLSDWASQRRQEGGAPIKIRIVKGANLEMEKTEASLEDWEIAPFESKIESDANFKKMILSSLQNDKLDAVHIGIASHNIFDLAFGLQLIRERDLSQNVDFEMLEGMANEVVDELLSQNASVLLYTPIVKTENYNSAIAYLVRRLDEGTQDGNFLKEGHELKTNTSKWENLKKSHLSSISAIEKLDSSPKRTQNRSKENYTLQSSFKNVANTDWILADNRDWIKTFIKKWQNPIDVTGPTIKVELQGVVRDRETIRQEGWSGMMPWHYELADEQDYRTFLDDKTSWEDLGCDQRAIMLSKAAVEIEKERGNLICVAVCELGKTIKEVDVEVSEAVDFANYYAQSIIDLKKDHGIRMNCGGVNLVLSPWNFPIAIPIGGVLASLAAGKKVILKPSTNAAASAYLIAQCLWRAGIPKSAFAFLPAKESSLDAFLREGNVFDAVILTGGTDTAKFLLDRNPKLKLYAETGGKNSTIVTSLSDRDQAIKNVVQSAFGNAGQKCSATSLLILEKEVFNDEHFKQLLKDASESKVHGNPWNLETEIGPLAVRISDKIKKSIEDTPKYQWLLEPKVEGNFLVKPGIKWGVTTEDFEYDNELFGPILSVMMANDLDHAIEIANGVEYGLTSGLESLDKREVAKWQQNIEAGNLYVNRSTTGAIVQRQPFGGIKASCFGFGMKAGGTNYILQFADIKPLKIDDYEKSYQDAWDKHFSKEMDYAHIRGQYNQNRYIKSKQIFLIADKSTPNEDVVKVRAAAEVLDIPVRQIENPSNILGEISHDVVVRSLLEDRLSDEFMRECHSKAIHIYERKPSDSGRIELLNYLDEQNFSYNFHRYGNLLGENS
jgi:RHH-type proline utilization regulon transcriptional repressor/proline dehydrogenase/delta 1-pyrroline-5-carboxylate dehydrogenase